MNIIELINNFCYFLYLAIRDYEHALHIDQDHRKANEGLKQAKKLQKQAERKDYYKILNVKRTATKQEIIKAYRLVCFIIIRT